MAQIYDVLAPAEGLHPTSHGFCTVFGFCYLLVWGYIADLSMVPRLRRGRLAGRALSHPFILRGQKNFIVSVRFTIPVRRPSLPGDEDCSIYLLSHDRQGEKEFHAERDWRALALTQVHRKRIVSACRPCDKVPTALQFSKCRSLTTLLTLRTGHGTGAHWH